ncbi:MAG: amidohydrolase family protein [Clostridia bacterium]|nr:amidohydrolase family protein [Clostridia bacterium]
MKFAYTNGIILDGTENMQPVENKIILTDGDKITAIVDKSANIDGYTKIDLQGKYIMPGLINLHVHLAGNGKPQKKQRDNEKLVGLLFSNPITAKIAKVVVAGFAKIELMSGVTTIRTVGGLRDYDTKIRDEIKNGKRIGPRIIASNEGITVKNGHMAGSVAVVANTIDEALALVDKAKNQNVDFVKIMVTGGVMDAKEKGVPGVLKMQPEMVKAICDKAHEYGFIVAAHVESPIGMKVALENGVDSIEHGAKPDDYIVELLKKNHAFVTSTISPALPYALFDRSISNASEVEQFNGNVVFEGIVECAKTAIANGIPMALGNDVGCPWITQYDFWRELVLFNKYVGVSNAFALYSATLNNARLAGVGDITGSIEVGKCADMIVTKDNPLENLNALRTVDMVVANGRLIKHPKVKRKAKLDKELDKFM